MKVWGLYSTRVDPHHASELIEVFADQAVAERVRDSLIGLPVSRHSFGLPVSRHSFSVWESDEDFPDLVVAPLEVRS